MSRRRKIILSALVAGSVVLVLSLRMGLNSLVWSRIVSAVRESYGVEVALDKLSLSLLNGKATVRGLRISDGDELLLAAEQVELSASIRDLIGGAFDFSSCVVTRPVLTVVVEKGETTNLARISGRQKSTDGPPRLVHFGQARIVDGRCLLVDALTDPDHPIRMVFEGVEASISDLQLSGKPLTTDPGDFRLDALMAQKGGPARIALVGWAPPLGGKPTIALHAAITGLDLGQIKPYVKHSTRVALGGDVIHLGVALRAQEGDIEDGAIVAQVVETETEIPLRFGGTMSDLVFDEDSKLAALFQLPFARLGHRGDVALTATWKAASDLGTGVLDAGKSAVTGVAKTVKGMVQLDPLGALGAASEGVVGAATAIGDGIAGSARRIFGGHKSKHQLAKQAAQEERDFSALHARCRREMLAAALESAKESTNGRRARIEEELEAQPVENADEANS